MADKPSGLVQGTLDMLILKTLDLEPMHGWGITRGIFQVNAGSLFPALRRLERAGCLRSEWRATENNRNAKYYILTTQGRRELERERREWTRRTAAISRILEATQGAVR
jgi:PadR family transcriptional regulator PadR